LNTLSPSDIMHPDWVHKQKIHDWKNHVPAEIQEIWNTFSRQQKKILATCAQEKADEEEWD